MNKLPYLLGEIGEFVIYENFLFCFLYNKTHTRHKHRHIHTHRHGQAG